MLSCSGLKFAAIRGTGGIEVSTCRKSDGAPIVIVLGLPWNPLYAFSLLLIEKLPRLDAREAKLFVRETHSSPRVDGRSCGSGIGAGTR